MAKKLNFDVYNCLDLMDNEHFFKELLFQVGDGCLNYYFYNWIMKRKKCEPKDLAVVLFWTVGLSIRSFLKLNRYFLNKFININQKLGKECFSKFEEDFSRKLSNDENYPVLLLRDADELLPTLTHYFHKTSKQLLLIFSTFQYKIY